MLHCQWDGALVGRQVGDRSRMAYWVDRSRYPTESFGTCDTPDLIEPIEDGADAVGVSALPNASKSTPQPPAAGDARRREAAAGIDAPRTGGATGRHTKLTNADLLAMRRAVETRPETRPGVTARELAASIQTDVALSTVCRALVNRIRASPASQRPRRGRKHRAGQLTVIKPLGQLLIVVAHATLQQPSGPSRCRAQHNRLRAGADLIA